LAEGDDKDISTFLFHALMLTFLFFIFNLSQTVIIFLFVVMYMMVDLIELMQ